MVLKKGTPKELTVEPYEVGLATTKAAKKTAAILLERTVSIFPMRISISISVVGLSYDMASQNKSGLVPGSFRHPTQ